MNEARLTVDVADWVVRQSRRSLPGDVQHQVRRMILDHLGGVVASSVGPVAATVGSHVSRTYTGSTATALGFGRTSVLGAALLNGTNGHGIETDDGYTPGSVHPSCAVLPAAFAVGQELAAPAERVLAAAAIGMELFCRIAAAGHPATRKNHFHNTAIAGVLGATVAVSVLLDLDAKGVANALGIAGSHSGGLWEFLGQSAEIKRVHAGKAARDGIISADLARSGLTGPTTILEGRDGYFAAFAGRPQTHWFPEVVRDGLGVKWVILETYVKPYPCCRHLHGVIDAALALKRSSAFEADDIDSVRVGTYAIATSHSGMETATTLAAQLSIPYTAAIALLRGRVTPSDFNEPSRFNTDVHRLMKKFQLHVDEAAEQAYPHSGRPADVNVRFKDGTEVHQRIEHPYGEPGNPMSDVDLEGKVRSLVEPVIGRAGADQLIDASWNFSGLDFLDDIDRAIPRPTSIRP